jgi:hypothetical protein
MNSREIQSFVDGPPQFSQPQDIRVAEGDGAVFRAQVAGAEHLQWWRDGIPLAGAAGDSASVNPVTVDDDGAQFTLVLSNALGRATSRTARLAVVPDFTARVAFGPDGHEETALLGFSEARKRPRRQCSAIHHHE